MGDLDDSDVLEWSEHQSRLLRQVAAGRPSNEAPDWVNIVEEAGSAGRGQLSAVRSLLVQTLVHDLKCAAWPLPAAIPHWRAEAGGFRGDAADAFTPSMRQRIDVADLCRRALDRLPETLDGVPPRKLPAVCALTLDELLSGRIVPP